jgi:hypothetical protein
MKAVIAIFRHWEYQEERGALRGDICLPPFDARNSISRALAAGQVKKLARGVYCRADYQHQRQERDSYCSNIRRKAEELHRANFWARGYFVSTVGLDETVIREYIRNQEDEDKRQDQLDLMADFVLRSRTSCSLAPGRLTLASLARLRSAAQAAIHGGLPPRPRSNDRASRGRCSASNPLFSFKIN